MSEHTAGSDAGCPSCDRLHEQIEELANLAAEHRNCSGCPTPWWLINWLDTERATRPIPPGEWDEEADAMFIDRAREATRDVPPGKDEEGDE